MGREARRGMGRRVCWMALAACFFAGGPAYGSEVPLEPVSFEVNYVTTFGDSVFVLGDIPELGGGDMRYAVKLAPGTYQPGSLPWAAIIGIPQGTTFTYRYAVRNDNVDRYRDAANGSFISGFETRSTAMPVPPRQDLSVFCAASDGVAGVSFLDLAGIPRMRPMQPVYGEPAFTVAGVFNRPSGRGIRGSIGGTTIDTPLHSVFHRGGGLYDYVPTAGSSVTGGIQTFAIASQFVPATRTVNSVTGRGVQVYAPRGYALHTTRRYPVLYMHDGQNVFLPGGPFGCWRAEIAADGRANAARVRELIIVAIDNSPSRLNEYNPDWGAPQQQNHNYNRFLVEELKPWVDATFRTLSGPENTGVMGSSFGGVASLSVALEYPGVYGRVAAMSTSFWATTLGTRVGNGELPASVRIYLDCGDTNDGGDDTVTVRDALVRRGRVLNDNVFFHVGFNQQHNEAAWSARLPRALEELFPITDEAIQINLPTPTMGDVDADGDVDLSDLAQLLAAFGTCENQPTFRVMADIDGNGCIDVADLALLLARFGTNR